MTDPSPDQPDSAIEAPTAFTTPLVEHHADGRPGARSGGSSSTSTTSTCTTGAFRAVREVNLHVHEHEITAFIGPSGCGKTTVLRCFNRMNDLIEAPRVEGTINYHGANLYGKDVDAVEVRRRIGMVFQKPNPFPKSIYDNIAFGPRIGGVKKKGELDDVVEQSLRGAALWDEVKDRLKASAEGLSGGQQQRLCIARAIAVEP